MLCQQRKNHIRFFICHDASRIKFLQMQYSINNELFQLYMIYLCENMIGFLGGNSGASTDPVRQNRYRREKVSF